MLKGATLALAAYHRPLMSKLIIPWAMENSQYRPPCKKYGKHLILVIYWYCPWESCKVTKKWQIYSAEGFANKPPVGIQNMSL